MKKIVVVCSAVLFSAIISCQTAPTPVKAPATPDVGAANAIWLKASNDQLKKFPVEGFAYKDAAVPAQKWDAWAGTAAPAIQAIVDKMPAGYILVVKGHTDARGPEQAEGQKPGNIKISADRAKAVVASLQKKGISADKITSKGAGSSELDPAFDSKDAKQRRVTFEVAPK